MSSLTCDKTNLSNGLQVFVNQLVDFVIVRTFDNFVPSYSKCSDVTRLLKNHFHVILKERSD